MLYLLLGFCLIGSIICIKDHHFLPLSVWIPLGIVAAYFLWKKLALISQENADEAKVVDRLKAFYLQKLSDEGSDKINSDSMKGELSLTDAEFEAVDAKARRATLDSILKGSIVNDMLSPDDYDNVLLSAKRMGVDLSFDKTTNAYLDRALLYWQIQNGDLPLMEVGLALHHGEACHFRSACQWMERRIVPRVLTDEEREREGVSEVMEEVIVEMDRGDLFITSDRIIFMGALGNANIINQDILALVPYPDGIQLEMNSGKGPILLCSDPDIALRILARLIGV